MGRYHIEISPRAERDLAPLPKPILRHVDARLRALADNPRPRGVVKLAGDRDLHRLQLGDYRVLYTIEDDRLVVLVARVAHRHDLHR
jgi:mRNA interferase RelE/StbE